MGEGFVSFFIYANAPTLQHSTSDIAGTFDKRRINFLLIIVPKSNYAVLSVGTDCSV